MDWLKNQYNKNETFIFKKYQDSLKSKVPMPPSELLVMPSFDLLVKLEHQRLLGKIFRQQISIGMIKSERKRYRILNISR